MTNSTCPLFSTAAVALFVSFLYACSTPTSPKQDGTEPNVSEAPPSIPTEPDPAGSSAPPQAKNIDGKTHMGDISQGQMAYNLENGTFTPKLDELGLGIEAEKFTLDVLEADQTKAIFTAIAKEPSLNSYAGGVSQLQDVTYGSILCESNQPSQDIAPPTLEGSVWSCGPGSQQIDVQQQQ